MKRFFKFTLFIALVAMLSGMTFLYASTQPQYIVVERSFEESGDIIIEKTLEVEAIQPYYGFGGTKTGRVTHTYR